MHMRILKETENLSIALSKQIIEFRPRPFQISATEISN